MDLFKYQACKKELELCKTVSGLEILIRKYTSEIQHMSIGSYWKDFVGETETQILTYKLLTLALKLFSAKSKRILPEFIYTTHLGAQQTLLNWILAYDKLNIPFTKLVNYEQFVDWFEFDQTLCLLTKVDFVENLNTIIGNKPIHFKVEFNNTLTPFDKYSTNLTYGSQEFIYAIRYKQVNFPDKPQTIWDLFLEELRVKADNVTEEKVARECLKLEQQITAIKSFKDFYVKP